MRYHRQGFTLIELLVVIAIIAILAAILFPVFMSAKASGRQARCVGNLRNIAEALAMYRDDNNGRNCSIWQGGRSGETSWDRCSFFFVITRYIGQKLEREGDGLGAGNDRETIYRCPAAPWLKQKWNQGLPQGNEGFAYTMNETGWTDSRYGRKYPAMGITEGIVKRPAKLIFVAECMGWTGYGVGYGKGTLVNNEQPLSKDGYSSMNPAPDEDIPLSTNGYLGRRHGSKSKIYNLRVSHDMGAMLLFYDGHVQRMSSTKGYNWSLF